MADCVHVNQIGEVRKSSMFRRGVIGAGFVVVTRVMLLPTPAWAQTAASSSIAGVVRDTTGAVLPGVTVEAASPALIEKVRSVVTDSQGQYQIVELRPGTYSITFTLVGFSAFRREGIELTTGFTAVVNADMQVGTLQETVTVSGASPVVDTRNTRTQTVFSRDVIDLLPTGKATQAYASVMVGAVLSSPMGAMQDVGGNKGEQMGEIVVHGGRAGEGRVSLDGMRYNNTAGSGGGYNRYYVPNVVAIEEITFETAGMSAEAETGGVHQNLVPRDGGNTFKFYFSGTGTNGDLQNSNLIDELRARGLESESMIKRNCDVGVGLGGPIKRDRLWFYTAHRWWASQEYYAGSFYNRNQGVSLLYEPDFSRQSHNELRQRDHSVRLTWKVSSKHKVTFYESVQDNCNCNLYINLGSQPRAPESAYSQDYVPLSLTQGTWSHPATNRLLFEAGATFSVNPKRTYNDSVTRNDISILETSSNFRYNAPDTGLIVGLLASPENDDFSQHNERLSVSYITGSHAFKVGLFTLFGNQKYALRVVNQDLYYTFRFGVPIQLTQWASPSRAEAGLTELAAFAQDQWTIKKLTLNLGVRFDRVNGFVPEQDRPGGQFVPALHIDRLENVPNFKDISPRLGAAYDLFGNGKTAVKVSLGRYLAAIGTGVPQRLSPGLSLVQSSTRTWNDQNRNYVPDCDLKNNGANGECGRLDNQKFGTIDQNTTYAPDVLEGWGSRGYNWQTSASVQHEVRPGLSVNVGYFRTWYGNFQVTDNSVYAHERDGRSPIKESRR